MLTNIAVLFEEHSSTYHKNIAFWLKRSFVSILKQYYNTAADMQLQQNENQYLILIRRVHYSQPWIKHKSCRH